MWSREIVGKRKGDEEEDKGMRRGTMRWGMMKRKRSRKRWKQWKMYAAREFLANLDMMALGDQENISL